LDLPVRNKNIFLLNIHFPKIYLFVIFLDALKCKVGAGADAVDTVCKPEELSCKIDATISKYPSFKKGIFFGFMSSDISDHILSGVKKAE
jgi:hypothetical protein